MITRYACALNGQGLEDIDPAIIITDIRESAPATRAVTGETAGRDGLRLARLKRESLSVSVDFEVREYDPARRKAIAEAVRAWAREGWLTVGDRPEQRLWVVCDRLPTVTSSLRWTDRLTVGFTAWALPYWQAAHPATAVWAGVSGSAALTPAGTAPCRLELEVTATAGPVDALTLSANGRTMRFEGLGLQRGQTFALGYDEAGRRQRITAAGASALGRRTADSADDLPLLPGPANMIALAADNPVSATLKGRGLWM